MVETMNESPPAPMHPARGDSLEIPEALKVTHPRTIFLIVDSGVAIRNILRTDAFAMLKAQPNLRIVIFSPLTDEDFRREVGGENIFVEPLKQWKPTAAVKVLRSLRKDIWSEKYELARFRENRLRKNRLGGVLALKLFLRDRSGGNIDRLVRKVESWEARFTPVLGSEYFDKYKPELVFYTTLYSKDHCIEIGAKQRGIPTVSFILSWDNPTTKGPFPVKPGRAILWNDIMRDELLRYHDFRPEQLFVSGPPQFDIYARPHLFRSREDFFRKWKLDPAKKLITYTTGTPGTAPFDHEIVDLLYKRMREGAFKEPAQLLVRLHPKDKYKVYERFENLPDLVLQLPGRAGRTNDSWNPTEDDMYGLAELMRYSDVVVNIASTITIDAACFDTPIVNAAFDGFKTRPYEESCLRYYEYEHYKRVVDTGGLKVSKNLEELVRDTQAYLNDPSQDAEGRERIRRTQCYRLDGRAGERIAHYLLSCLKESPKEAA